MAADGMRPESIARCRGSPPLVFRPRFSPVIWRLGLSDSSGILSLPCLADIEWREVQTIDWRRNLEA